MQFDLTGKLLISTPAMGDPRFAHSVILLCAHSPKGAFGLVLNRPIPHLRMAEILRQLDLPETVGACADRPVMAGGPVETTRGFVLHSDDVPGGEGSQALGGGRVLTASTDILAGIAQGQGPQRWLLALGYSGWGSGQLEQEIAENAWLTCDACDDLIFAETAPESQWEGALKSIGINPVQLSAVAGRA
ncbi:MAG: YqgE/AlgH family protein [Pararhodobacter sp.]|nr:YqgE/AlgH family protein [Pararhodobacter sp.]